MPTGRSRGVGAWKALGLSATKIATKAALATMKPAGRPVLDWIAAGLGCLPCRHLRPPWKGQYVAGLTVIASQLAWKGTALSRNWATWLTKRGAYWNRAPWPESG